jgi:hypothetical protein
MTTDKKSCENCIKVEQCCICTRAKVLGADCDSYQRNPRLWLSILPEESCYYFYRKNVNKWGVAEVFVKEGKLFWKSNDHEVKGTYEWQGPISPEN